MSDSVVPAEGEHLTNGWEPDAPPDDTLVRRAVLVHARWPVAVATALGVPYRSTDRWSGALIGEVGELSNPVVLARPLAAEDAADLLAEVADLVPPTSPYFLLNPWLDPRPLPARAGAHRAPAADGPPPRRPARSPSRTGYAWSR